MNYLKNKEWLCCLDSEMMISFLKFQPKSFRVTMSEDFDEEHKFLISNATSITRKDFYNCMPSVASMDQMDISAIAILKTMERTESLIGAFVSGKSKYY